LEPLVSLGANPAGGKNPPKLRTITRDELESLAMAAPAGAAAHDAHDDE
jgi:hypothetical protein